MEQKIKVVVVVYNRYTNIKRWLECWSHCDQKNAELIVIHNYDNENECRPYYDLCMLHQVTYIPRRNIGFDIGAFQDVCKERLPGFNNDWDLLFWITDDNIIMKKDFLNTFVFPLNKDKNIGVVCAEFSREKVEHIRTSGFCIRKSESKRLAFQNDKIISKKDCYHFEHAGGKDTFYQQIKKMGLRIMVPADLKDSPVWDIGHRAHLNRWQEHYAQFPQQDKIVFICPIFNSYPQIISSMICQTYPNWELILIHDGPNKTGIEKMVKQTGDDRISYYETEQRIGNWGHGLRRQALIDIKEGRICPDASYVVITNADNYHTPVYCEYMLRGFENKPNAVATYCSRMVHSYKAWDIIDCKLQRGYVDCAGVMIKKDIACDVGWNDITSHSSDFTYFSDIAKKYGTANFIKVAGCLLIHN